MADGFNHLPVFGTDLASCSTCELDGQRQLQKLCYAYRPPAKFNGLMLIGEGPGQHEVLQGRPFVGQSGKLLRALVGSAGLELDECWITNSTLCLDGATQVRLADGSLARIGYLVKNRLAVDVLSFDENTRQLVSRRVTGWHRNRLGKRALVHLTFDLARKNANGKSRALLTEDHPVLTDQGWLPAGAAHRALVATGELAPSENALDIAIGIILGDGHIARSTLTLSNGVAQESYVRLKAQALAALGTRQRKDRTRPGMVVFETAASAFWRAMRKKFYGPTRKRVLPDDVIENLSDLTLAVWFLDDGHLAMREGGGRHPCASLSTASKPRVAVEKLAKKLCADGLTCTVQRKGIIAFTVTGTRALSKKIAQYVPPALQYKLLPEDRGQFEARHFRSAPPGTFFDRAQVTQVGGYKTKPNRLVYCLDVEGTHNFVTPGGVVHNCRPATTKDKGLHEQFPNAISSCLSRLEAEIAACKPRVIVTLGAAAFIAMTGRDKVSVHREPFACPACNSERKVGPVLQCSAPVQQDDGTAKACGELHFIEGATMEAQAAFVEGLKLHGCKSCGARLKNVRSKMVKCPACGGRKMRDTEVHHFVHDYNLSQVAGAIFEPAAGQDERGAHEIDAWFREQGVRYLVPTYHPAFLLRDQQFMAKAVQKHLAKARRLLTEDAPWPVEYEVTRDVEVLKNYVAVAPGTESPVFTVDVETESIRETSEGPVRGDARNPYDITEIKVVGIHRQGAAHSLVVDTRGVQIMSGHDELLNALQDFLEDPNIPKCYQNGLYDLPCFVHLWGFTWERLVESYADDTLGAHAALYPDEPHDLGHITFSFTDARAWKPEKRVKGQAVHEDFAELALYNARDIWNTDAVRASMGAANGRAVPGGKLHRAGLSKVYEIDSDLRKVAFEMQMVGMPVNIKAREAAADKARGFRDAALVRCRAAAGVAKFQGEFNPFSWKDLQKVLFDTKEGFGLPILKQTKKGASSDEGTIYKLLGLAKDEPVIQFLRALLDVREHHKVLSTYVESDKLAPRMDGRIHANWKPWGARTGRFSSSPNIQNIPLWLRHIFEAPEGRVIVGADGDQIELRGIGALSGDAELIRRCMTADEKRKLEPDYDPHSFVAGIAFGTQYTGLLLSDPAHDKKLAEVGACKCQTCRRKALRDLEKRVIYGGNYGAGAKKIHEVILQSLGVDYKGPPITVEMVAHIQRTIDKAFPGISKWRERAYREAHEKREIRSPLHGRRRIFPLGDIPFTEIANFPIQSLSADIMNEAAINIYYELASVDPTAQFVAQIHDAIYIEAAEDKGEAVGKLLEKHMTCEHVLQPGAPAMRFTASAKVGRKLG